MSRRGSHYKGGVTRGREDQPRRGKLVTIKRGSPITSERPGLIVLIIYNTAAGELCS